MQSFNWIRMTQDEQDRIRAKARVHLEFCKELYQLQMRAGRYFLHEHPRRASSWLEDCMEVSFAKRRRPKSKQNAN